MQLCFPRVQGQVVWMFQIIMKLLRLGNAVRRLALAPTLEEQRVRRNMC